MNILCIGGGPAGLYFSLLVKLRHPHCQVTVVERNRALNTFGWGVVLSDQTLANLQAADAVSAQAIGAAFNHWDDVEVFFRGGRVRTSGHGFCGIGRRRLLNLLQARCAELGVDLVFDTDVADDQALAAHYQADLVIACDGLNSRIRTRYASSFQPDIERRDCRFVWLGTKQRFDAFTFAFVQTAHGWFQAHAYQFDADTSTFIIETPDAVWRAHGLDQMSQAEGVAFCERLFAPYLDGHALVSNAGHLRGSAIWSQFPRVICKRWVHRAETGDLGDGSGSGSGSVHTAPIVLMGDAAHTAHYSIGSGTKLALEDAIDLARELGPVLDRVLVQGLPQHAVAGFIAAQKEAVNDALIAYEARRSIEVLKIQNAARNSTEWFENVARYAHLPIEQFTYSLLTRSQRISHENLRLRDPVWLQGFEAWWAGVCGARNAVAPTATATATAPSPSSSRSPVPMLTPFTVRGLRLKNRVLVSPMATYSAVEGVVQDFHLVHLGARALGGAALVLAEMTSPTPDGRITPGCPGLWTDEHAAAWARTVQFVHQHSSAAIGMQLGHSGPKGSTQRGWDEADEPLPEVAMRVGQAYAAHEAHDAHDAHEAHEAHEAYENWPLIAASAVPYGPQNQTPRAMTRADMDVLTAQFVAAAQRAAQAGFDWLELHAAHGYLLSSFICPLTNLRTDAYGGSLANRCRYPLEVFRAVRAVWPAARPMSVRLSAHDWAPGGNTADDAVQMARWFKDAACDVIDVSSGQTTRQAKPVYGRMYQTPFADRIRNEVGIATIAVGAITEADQVNSIIGAGRADLCAIARPHLANPAWTLHEAARSGSQDGVAVDWPRAYWSGRDQLYREMAKR